MQSTQTKLTTEDTEGNGTAEDAESAEIPASEAIRQAKRSGKPRSAAIRLLPYGTTRRNVRLPMQAV